MKLVDILERTIDVDTSYVKPLILNHFDDITKAETDHQLKLILNRLFSPYNVKFEVGTKNIDNFTPERDERFMGIWGGVTLHNHKIVITVIRPSFQRFLADNQTQGEVIATLAGYIRHELVHREQGIRSNKAVYGQHMSTKMKTLSDWDQYLADPHEMYAMAHEMLEQLKHNNVSRENILASLRDRQSQVLIDNAPRFADMHEAFRTHDPLNVMARVKKLLYQIITQ